MLNNLQAQHSHKQLWGTWVLDTIGVTKQGVSEKHSLTDLLADKENLPRNMFTMLYFFDNQVGVGSTETEFVPAENLSLKGSFTTDNGKLIVTMQEEQPRVFTYAIENEVLKIWYTQEDTQFYLIYKLF
jgi:hypothetical protein